MMITAEVLEYNENWQAHKCRIDDEEKWIDLTIDGSLHGVSCQDLIGKIVEFDRTHSFLLIAHGVRIVETA